MGVWVAENCCSVACLFTEIPEIFRGIFPPLSRLNCCMICWYDRTNSCSAYLVVGDTLLPRVPTASQQAHGTLKIDTRITREPF